MGTLAINNKWYVMQVSYVSGTLYQLLITDYYISVKSVNCHNSPKRKSMQLSPFYRPGIKALRN